MIQFNKNKTTLDKENTKIKIVADLEKKIDSIMSDEEEIQAFDHPVITDEKDSLERKISTYKSPMELF